MRRELRRKDEHVEEIVLTNEELERIKEQAVDESVFRNTVLQDLSLVKKRIEQMNGCVREHEKQLAANTVAHRLFLWIFGVLFSIMIALASLWCSGLK